MGPNPLSSIFHLMVRLVCYLEMNGKKSQIIDRNVNTWSFLMLYEKRDLNTTGCTTRHIGSLSLISFVFGNYSRFYYTSTLHAHHISSK